MGSLAQDLRYSARRLEKAHWFSITVILMLAFGIGATTTIFSLIEGILLRPLPFHDPSRLVELGEHVGNNPGIGATARDFRAYAAESGAFSSMGGFRGATFELAGGVVPENVPGARLTASIFPTLGVQPVLGRVFTEQEDDGHATVVVLSYALWTNRYHRDFHVLGSSIELNRKQYTVIGVMPRDFEFPLQVSRLDQARLWVPMSLSPDELSDQAAGFWGFQMVARLKEGVPLSAAKQDAVRVAQQIMRGFPANMASIEIRGDVSLLSEVVTGDTQPLLRMLFVSVFVVLLIACANVAILMLVRAVRRHRDSAVRIALGAPSAAIVRDTVLEGLLLSLVGGTLGLALAAAALRIGLSVLPDSLPRMDSISIDGTVALFALGLGLFTGVVCSLAPAFVALHTNLIASLKEGLGFGGTGHTRLRSSLAIAEIAIAMLLLTMSGAFLRSYQKMLAIDPGIRPEHVLVAAYELPEAQYPTDTPVKAFDERIVSELTAKPGITAVGIGDTLPSSGNSGMSAYTLEGERSEGWQLKFAGFGAIYGNYFEALGIPLLAGRAFTDQDRANSPLVVMVSKSMAEHSWPGQNALGKRMHAGNPKKGLPWATVVGVVGNTRIGARDKKGNDQWYVPAQQPATLYGSDTSGAREVPPGGAIVLRSALPPEELKGILEKSVAAIDPSLALDQIRTMGDVVSTTEAPRRIMTELISVFAITALLLAITGIYAVISFAVSLRTQEIAIRMALGAQRDRIAGLILRFGATIALLGCAVGVAASIALSRFVQSFLFGIRATDPLIYAVSIIAMLLVAIIACALPAVRAAAADPVKALRSAQ
jgi:putative ABC transport system permease protein